MRDATENRGGNVDVETRTSQPLLVLDSSF